MYHKLILLEVISREFPTISVIDVEPDVGMEVHHTSGDLHCPDVITNVRDPHVIAHLRDADANTNITQMA